MGMTQGDSFQDKYLKPYHIPDGHYTATIVEGKHIALRDRTTGQQENKPAIWFAEFSIPLILNKTNFSALVKAFGDNSDLWLNRQVQLISIPDNVGGEVQDVIRLRVPLLNENPQALGGRPGMNPYAPQQPAPMNPGPLRQPAPSQYPAAPQPPLPGYAPQQNPNLPPPPSEGPQANEPTLKELKRYFGLVFEDPAPQYRHEFQGIRPSQRAAEIRIDQLKEQLRQRPVAPAPAPPVSPPADDGYFPSDADEPYSNAAPPTWAPPPPPPPPAPRVPATGSYRPGTLAPPPAPAYQSDDFDDSDPFADE